MTESLMISDKTISENEIEHYQDKLESFLAGKIDEEEVLKILRELDYKYGFLSEKTGDLRRLVQKKRINDLAIWRMDITKNIQAIENLMNFRNHSIVRWNEEQKLFKTRIEEPWDVDTSPLIFRVVIYVNGHEFHTISCTVDDEELARLPITNNSLSKIQTRRRRINTYYQSFMSGFQNDIERKWRSGDSLENIRQISWSEVTKR